MTRDALIHRALVLVPTQRALAVRLGMTKSRLSRVVGGATPSLKFCLRLADTLGESPSAVFRAFGYEEEAAILERAYPSARRPRGDVAMMNDATRLTPERRRLIRELVAALAPPVQRRRTKR